MLEDVGMNDNTITIICNCCIVLFCLFALYFEIRALIGFYDILKKKKRLGSQVYNDSISY